jgi:hypothetical protein
MWVWFPNAIVEFSRQVGMRGFSTNESGYYSMIEFWAKKRRATEHLSICFSFHRARYFPSQEAIIDCNPLFLLIYQGHRLLTENVATTSLDPKRVHENMAATC